MDSLLSFLLGFLARYKYAAMFGVLFLCGLGLPVPEEVTLISSGLAVGWKQADFLLASAACVAGILAGDLLIFVMGRVLGRKFLASRPMQWILTEKRQRRIDELFAKHGSKAIFFARFLMGVRIGVYAYAGQHGMGVFRFLFLDLLGALISGPTSIFIGKLAAERIAEPEAARAFAENLIRQGHHWVWAILAAVAAAMALHWLIRRRRARMDAAAPLAPPRLTSAHASPPAREPERVG
jgi:membrane protein DedA with SNARE-associated domain